MQTLVREKPLSLNDQQRHEADEKADAIINQWVLQTAGAAFLPASMNWAPMIAIDVANLIRVAHVYGVTIGKEDATKRLRDFIRLGGMWFAIALPASKLVASVVDFTGGLYLWRVAADATISGSASYAFGVAAKAYFGHGVSDMELGPIIRAAYDEGKKRLTPQELKHLLGKDKDNQG